MSPNELYEASVDEMLARTYPSPRAARAARNRTVFLSDANNFSIDREDNHWRINRR